MGNDCIFCAIAEGRTSARVVHQDESVVAFEDLNPQAPTHVLVIPREHIPRAIELKPEHAPLLSRLFEVAANLARDRRLEDGFRLVVNNGPRAGQTVFHLHVHLLGGRSMKWPPG